MRAPYPSPVLYVPRSVRFAAWGTAVLAGRADRADLADLVRAIRDPQDDDHLLSGPDATEEEPGLLAEGFDLLAGAGVRGLRPVLPVPGDLSGLPGPPEFNVVACEVGECVIGTGGPDGSAGALGLVPLITEYGSALEPGTSVTWTAHAVERRPHLDVADLGEADRDLRRALTEATTLLRELDVARWRPEVAEQWADLSGAVLDPLALPPGWPARAVAVLGTALRLRAIVDLAVDDDGGAVSGWEAGRRRTALRQLDGVARRAVATAGNAR